MKKTRIVVCCMFDSVHSARWLKQFENKNFEFYLVPSKKFKYIHPMIAELLKTDSFKLKWNWIPIRIQGYFDYMIFVLPYKLFKIENRKYLLQRVISTSKPKFVHALEIQGAGYLCDDVLKTGPKSFQLILTNWGSDIYYFKNFENHSQKIRSILSKSDLYSAECERDYALARELGYQGKFLPCIPNAGGFDLKIIRKTRSKPSKRKLLLVKTYGCTFGRGNLAISVVGKILSSFEFVEAYFYSVTSDLLQSVMEIQAKYPKRVRYSTQERRLTQEELYEIFENSRVYIGASISDGISTSFLEAIIFGAYPIQTNTSCANEWIKKGAIASIVSPSVEDLESATLKALTDDTFVDFAADANSIIAEKYLDQEKLKSTALEFYL